MLTYNAKPAEISYGCVFAENFDSATNVAKNGGTVTGTIKGGKLYGVSGTGASFARSQMNLFLTNGGSLRVRWTLNETGSSSRPILFYGIDANYLIKVLHKGSDGAINVELRNGSGNNYYKVTGSAPANGVVDIVVTWNKAGTTLTLFVNGVYADNDATAGSLTFTDGTTFGAMQVGFADGLTPSTDVAIDTVMIYNKTILAVFGTEGIALDYYRNSTFDYEKRATCILPMTAECHDATNLRTLDVSGNGNHFQFGDGSTSTTYPTKLARRGYSFDGGDYLQSGNITLSGGCTIFRVSRLPNPYVSTYYGFVSMQQAADNQLGILTNWSDKKFYVLGPGTGGTYSSGSITRDFNGICSTAVVYDQNGTTNATRLKAYSNGKERTLSFTGTVQSSLSITTPIVIGKWVSSGDKFEVLDECLFYAVFPFALTPLQIADLHLKCMKNINLI